MACRIKERQRGLTCKIYIILDTSFFLWRATLSTEEMKFEQVAEDDFKIG